MPWSSTFPYVDVVHLQMKTVAKSKKISMYVCMYIVHTYIGLLFLPLT